MKHSGIEWIGEIPKEWNVMSIKHYCISIYAGGTPQSNKSEYWDGDIPWIPSGSCKNCIIESAPKYITQQGLENSSTKLIPSGTTVMAMTGATCSNVGFVTFDTCMNQSVVAYIENKEKTISKFLFYLLQGAQEDILTHKTGGAQSGINVDDCKNIVVPYVPLFEQQNIANYLDKVCGEVDELIALQEQMIEELKAYKQSVITEAVTKGLNPNVPMKESGIDWIGEIPERWRTIRIKFLLKERKDRSETGLEEPLSMSQKYGLIPTKEMDVIPNIASSFVGAKLVYQHDLVFNKLKAHLGVFAESNYDGLVSPDYAVYYSSGLVDVKYLEYLFKSPQYIGEFIKLSTGVGAGLTRLYTSDLYSIDGIVPPIEEQREIIAYIEQLSSEINDLIAIKQSKIEELKEYKKSVIYEYVTGKKEVV